jgi:hypothetical protein
MPVAVAVYDLAIRDTMTESVIDLMIDTNTPADHVVYLAFNLSQQGYRVGTAPATDDIDTYATEEMIFITGPVVGGPISDADRQVMRESMLNSIANLIQRYEDAP